MFRNTQAFSGFSVDDLSKAKDFYHNKLGLQITESMGLLELRVSGTNKIIVYPKPNHEPATFTILNFPVDDIEKAVDELVQKGITFEQYTGGLQTDARGIFRGGGPLIAWFKDPAGNLLSVIETDH